MGDSADSFFKARYNEGLNMTQEYHRQGMPKKKLEANLIHFFYKTVEDVQRGSYPGGGPMSWLSMNNPAQQDFNDFKASDKQAVKDDRLTMAQQLTKEIFKRLGIR